jgi:uncharacterized protein with PIN domain
MAIPCPECGRHYDVTLFQFGRTIHCTCGARVGLEKRISLPDTDREPQFAADAMLGKLTRWLRILGYDTWYEPDAEDGRLVRTAVWEERYLLTRDRRIPEEWRIEGCLILEPDDLFEQLRLVASRFGLFAGAGSAAGVFSRCPACNALLAEARRDDLENRVPERVLEAVERFSRCPGCDKVYWEGSHTRRIRRRLAELRGGDGAGVRGPTPAPGTP